MTTNLASTVNSFTALAADTQNLLTIVKNLLPVISDIPITCLTANELLEFLEETVNGKYQPIQTAAQQLGVQLGLVETAISTAVEALSTLKTEGEHDFTSLKAKVELYIARIETVAKSKPKQSSSSTKA